MKKKQIIKELIWLVDIYISLFKKTLDWLVFIVSLLWLDNTVVIVLFFWTKRKWNKNQWM